MFLTSIKYQPINKNCFPYNLPLFQNITELMFNKPVTILVGENGTGKSTLLEALAYRAKMVTIASVSEESSFSNINGFADCFQLSFSQRPKKGFFLRSDDFIGYIKRLANMRKEAEENLLSIESEYQNKSKLSKDLASMPHRRTLGELQNLYGNGLEYRSHGESYLDFFQSRFKACGLYLLDEPEVPLSPMKQLTLISLIKQLVTEKSQFIIATHSPILMAIPDAEIISLDTLPPVVTSYEELEHVQITKSFLENPDRYLRYL